MVSPVFTSCFTYTPRISELSESISAWLTYLSFSFFVVQIVFAFRTASTHLSACAGVMEYAFIEYCSVGSATCLSSIFAPFATASIATVLSSGFS